MYGSISLFVSGAQLVQETNPCSIIRTNLAKTATYTLASFSTICILLDVCFEGVEQLEWWPLIIYCLGVGVYAATHAQLFVKKQLSVFVFPKGKAKTAKHPREDQTDEAYQQATVFNDAASLRGFSHRLRAMRVQTAWRKKTAMANCDRSGRPVVDCFCPYCLQTRVIGLAYEVETDGYKAWTPIHAVSADEPLLFSFSFLWRKVGS